MHDFKSKKVAILGWGMNGLDAYEYLLEQGAEITIFDQKEQNEIDLSKVNIKEACI